MRYYIKVSPLLTDEELGCQDREEYPEDFPYHWGPFSTRQDTEAAQRILIDTYLGLDLMSMIEEEEEVYSEV